MVDLEAALQEQLLDVTVAHGIAQVPGDGLQDQRCLEVPALEIVLRPALQLLGNRAQDHRPRGRDFAAWLGLTPVQRSSGSKERLGKTSKMGERSLRRLLIIGASAVARWAARKGVPAGSWLGRMLARKSPMLVRVAL